MNAFALVEAYVALRERGDQTEAARVRPYALLLGAFKIADTEKQPHAEWTRAFAAYWNARTKETLIEQTHIAGLYLLSQSGKPYQPLHRRK